MRSNLHWGKKLPLNKFFIFLSLFSIFILTTLIYNSNDKIPDTNWNLLTKCNSIGFLMPIGNLFVLILITFLSSIIITGSFFLYLFNKKTKIHHRDKINIGQSKKALEENFESLLQYANDMIFISDETGSIKYVNRSVILNYGYSEEEILKLNISDIRVDLSRINFKEYREKILTNRGYIYEGIHRRKNGSVFPVELSSQAIEIEGQNYYQTFVRDISERKESELKITRLNRVYSVLSNINQLIVRVKDKSKLYVEVSRIAVNDGGFRMVWLGIINKADNKLEIISSSGYINNYLENLNINLNNPDTLIGPTGQCLKIGNHRICNDIQNDPNMILWKHNAFINNYKSSGSFPIKMRNNIIGVINFYSEEINFFDDDEIKLLDELASDISFAIESFGNEEDRIKAEAAVKESEKRFKTIFDSLNDAIFIHDLETGEIIDANKKVMEMFGYDLNELRSLNVGDISFNEFPYTQLDALNKIKTAAKDKPQIFPWKAKDKYGNLFWVEVNMRKAEINGKMRLLVVARDITERRLIEEALIKSEELFRKAFKTSPDSININRLEDGLYIDINDGFCKIMGYSREEVIGKTSLELNIWAIPEDREKLVKGLRENGVFNNLEAKFKRKDGILVSGLMSAIIIDLDRVPHILSITRNVEEIIKAQQALRESEQKYRSLVQHNPDGIFIIDFNGKFISVNEAVINALGYSEIELLNMSLWDVVPEQYHKLHRNRFKEILEGKNLDEPAEYEIIKKNGNKIIAEIRSVPYYKDGKIIGSQGIATDITDKKKNLNELLAAKEKAEELNKLKSSFLANMSHELRTPLVGILGFAEILNSELDNIEHKEMTSKISQSGNRLHQTLNQLLDLSRIESNKLELNIAEIKLEDITHKQIKINQSLAIKKDIKVKEKIINPDVTALLDGKLFTQVLDNLINNALKYTNEGEVIVEVSEELFENKSWAVIKVIDTGIGISKEDIKIIFDEYRQVSEGLGRQYEGTGLGLTITKKTIELMKGKIEVFSELGVGSTFKISFPSITNTAVGENVQEENAFEIITEKFKEEYKQKILFVDNDKFSRDFIKISLRNYYVVEVAEDGETAIQKVNESAYAAILMDIGLGRGMNGIETANEIRKIKGYETIPIIAVTAFAMKGDKEKMLSDGLTDYISKPFMRQDIIDLLKKHL